MPKPTFIGNKILQLEMSLLCCLQYIGGAFLLNLHWLCLTHYTGKLCIEVTPASKIAFISEELCIGCGICVKVCSGYGHFSTCRYLSIFLSMLRDQGLQPHHIFCYWCRNARLRPFKSSIYQRTWTKTLLIAMDQTHSSCTGSQRP